MNAYGFNRPCAPSVGEILQAEKIFREYIQKRAHETQHPPESPLHSSPELIIKCALGAVWEAGRLYQMKQQAR